ncbi:epsin-1 [Platysternon megacephalum]|uniref:Epsin-1 n=1 Tax=Platysternon megacephalum TaxID=55544 RepID=A0A4D9DWT1_9SAUR|nr:epsin-1 [Platysternon megacephalum]
MLEDLSLERLKARMNQALEDAPEKGLGPRINDMSEELTCSSEIQGKSYSVSLSAFLSGQGKVADFSEEKPVPWHVSNVAEGKMVAKCERPALNAKNNRGAK